MTRYTPAPKTGHPHLDRRLCRLMEATGDFVTACAKGQGKELPLRELDTLQRLAKKYFAEEEALQAKERYPDYPVHRQQHDAFLRQLQKLDFQLRTEGAAPEMCAALRESLLNWLAGHIQQSDAPLAAHLLARQPPPSQTVVIANLMPGQSMHSV